LKTIAFIFINKANKSIYRNEYYFKFFMIE
jgi:hypothetical protein